MTRTVFVAIENPALFVAGIPLDHVRLRLFDRFPGNGGFTGVDGGGVFRPGNGDAVGARNGLAEMPASISCRQALRSICQEGR